MTDNEMKCAKYILGLLMLAGCSRLEQPQGRAIMCRAEAPEQTKGAGVTDTEALESSGLGLFAWQTAEGTPFNGTIPYLQNCGFTYDSNIDLWKGGVYWPIGYWLSFFAYTPYSADVSTGNLKFPSSDYVSGYPRLQFTPDASAASQVDLCLATPVLDRAASTNDGVVPLSFSHVLTRLCVQVRWTGTSAQVAQISASGQTVRVLGMEIGPIVGTNKLTYGRTSFLWDSPSAGDYDASYEMSVAEGSFRDVALPAAGTYSTDFWNMADACLYVLPQSLVAGSELAVTYGIFNSDGSMVSEESVSFDIGMLPQNLWPAGMTMTYSVTLDLLGHYTVEADVTYDCNAGTFVAPGTFNFNQSSAGAFLGGDFDLSNALAGSYVVDGMGLGGSSAGGFTTD